MEASDTYKDWVRYLKRKGLYSEYMLTLSRIASDIYEDIIYGKLVNGKYVRRSLNDSSFPNFLQNTEHIFKFRTRNDVDIKKCNIPLLIKWMKRIDNRISNLKNWYKNNGHGGVLISNNIVWKDAILDFHKSHLIEIYGKERTDKMFKKLELKRKKKLEEERKKNSFWTTLLNEESLATNTPLCDGTGYYAVTTSRDITVPTRRVRRYEVRNDRFNNAVMWYNRGMYNRMNNRENGWRR